MKRERGGRRRRRGKGEGGRGWEGGEGGGEGGREGEGKGEGGRSRRGGGGGRKGRRITTCFIRDVTSVTRTNHLCTHSYTECSMRTLIWSRLCSRESHTPGDCSSPSSLSVMEVLTSKSLRTCDFFLYTSCIHQ